MKKTIVAWVIFFGGYSIELAIDYLLRIHDGDISTGGIPAVLWYLLQIMLAIVSIVMVFVASKPLGSYLNRVIITCVQAVVAVSIYLVIGLSYILGLGIDSL